MIRSLEKICTAVADFLKPKPIVGIVVDVRCTKRGLSNDRITIFSVHSDDGKVYHLGVVGHDRAFYAKRVEVYPSKESIGREFLPSGEIITYYGMLRYQFL